MGFKPKFVINFLYRMIVKLNRFLLRRNDNVRIFNAGFVDKNLCINYLINKRNKLFCFSPVFKIFFSELFN